MSNVTDFPGAEQPDNDDGADALTTAIETVGDTVVGLIDCGALRAHASADFNIDGEFRTVTVSVD